MKWGELGAWPELQSPPMPVEVIGCMCVRARACVCLCTHVRVSVWACVGDSGAAAGCCVCRGGYVSGGCG